MKPGWDRSWAPASRSVAVALVLALPCVSPEGLAVMAGSAGGNPPDSPALRVDANVPASPWRGVAALQVAGGVYTATAIDRRHVITAAHVVGPSAGPTLIFNVDGERTYQIPASAVFVHPAYVSFNNPNLQNDLAIVELASDLPADVPAYPIRATAIAAGSRITVVGYGASGQGDVGASIGGSATVRRGGENRAEAFETAASGGGESALYFADFDGGSAPNAFGDAGLGNRLETSLAGGDSGSPAFLSGSSGPELVAVNNFVASFEGGPATLSTFGTGFGGNLLHAYRAWIQSIQARPLNDSFGRRAPLAAAAGSLVTSSSGATRQPGEPAHAGAVGGRSVWWTWTAPSGGLVSFDTAGSDFDTVLALYRGGALSALAVVAANDNDSGVQTSRASAQVQAGDVLQIVVDGAAGGAGGIRLSWNLAASAGVTENDIPMPPWALGLLALALAGHALRARGAR